MLTWDEEIKPTSPASNSGLFTNRQMALSLREAALPAHFQASAPNSSRAARIAEDTVPRGVLGLNACVSKYIANRRAAQPRLETLYPNEERPFPRMSEMIDLKKERNFLETRVIECQTGGALSWN